VDFDLIDHFIKVTDKDGAIMTRRLSREEGLFVGWSCGSAVVGALEYARQHLREDDLMVVVLPDHGTRYLAKIYNDSWMKDHGFLESREFATARDIIHTKNGTDRLVTIDRRTKVGEAVRQLTKEGISQIPVTDGENIVGSLVDSKLLSHLIENPEVKEQAVGEVMDKPLSSWPSTARWIPSRRSSTRTTRPCSCATNTTASTSLRRRICYWQ
jgi:cystathionine beta-synthase